MSKFVFTAATIAKLELGPDDAVVIRITDPKYRPSADDVAEMRRRTKEVLGDREVLILAHGIDLEILQKETT